MTNEPTLLYTQRRRNGGVDVVARPRNVETTEARVSFRPDNIFPHFCMRFLKLPLFVVVLPACNKNVTLSWYYQ